MNIELVDTLIKFISIYMCIAFTYFKIISFNHFSKKTISTTILSGILLAILQITLKNYIPSILAASITYILNSFILSCISRIRIGFSLVITIISVSISYSIFCISAFIVFFISTFLKITNYSNPINFIVIAIIQFYINYKLFKIKRFKNGFPFIRNNYQDDYLDIFVLIVSIIIVFVYFLIGNYKKIYPSYLFSALMLFTTLMLIILRKTFILYQKQKLLNKTLKDYETELTETKSKLQTALQEKHNLVKSNHEFYHRQEALKQKLNTLLQSQQLNYNSETSEEYSEILDRINNLSKEYANKIKSRPSLPKTNIPELDDMFTYLQSECEKYDIEFILKINADVNHMIETVIPKNKLETLIGDLIRNSIIAINHSNNKYKSIMTILGVKDNFFEFCVHDSGLEFEISTLLKLGTEPASTHTDNGGTGIGFITTFETLNYCKASLIINENIKEFNNYTKSIVIRFDNCNKYIVNSYRANIIRDCNNFRKDIIINNIDL